MTRTSRGRSRKLRAVKPKPMTPEELRELETKGMESTDSEEWIGSSEATSIASDYSSETATEDEFSDEEEHKSVLASRQLLPLDGPERLLHRRVGQVRAIVQAGRVQAGRVQAQ